MALRAYRIPIAIATSTAVHTKFIAIAFTALFTTFLTDGRTVFTQQTVITLAFVLTFLTCLLAAGARRFTIAIRAGIAV